MLPRSFGRPSPRSTLGPVAPLGFADDAEAEVVTRIVWRVRGTGRRPQVGETRSPTAAAIHSLDAGSRTARVLFRRTGVSMCKIEAPFPDVAGHIFDGEEARAARKGADGRCYRVSVVHPRIAPGERGTGIGEIRELAATGIIAPRVFSAVGPASGELPFGFGRQAIGPAILLAEPLTEFHCFETRDIDHGMIGPGAIHSFRLVSRIELLELRVRNRMLRDVKTAKT